MGVRLAISGQRIICSIPFNNVINAVSNKITHDSIRQANGQKNCMSFSIIGI